MNQENSSNKDIEFNGKSLLNLAIKLCLIAGWTGLTIVAADNIGWVSDGWVLTDNVTTAAALVGDVAILQSNIIR